MAKLPGRRLVFSGAVALTIAVAPAVAAFTVVAGNQTPTTVAQGTQCPAGEQLNPERGTCAPITGGYEAGGEVAKPNPVQGGGAMSEGQLTDTNPGVGSPTHGGR